MVDFSKDPAAGGFFAPERFESRIYDCEVVGEIPRDLDGAFVRVSTEWLYPPLFPDDAILSADGLVSMFRFKNGVVDFVERWVRTQRWEHNRAARRQLYGLYRNPFTDDPSIREQTIERPASRSVANTNVLAHAGRLFAMKEDGPPYELDPQTLATRGPMTFGGGWHSETFTAHPKIDPVTGEMITFGYEATGLASNAIHLYTLDRAGEVTSEVRFEAPYVSMVHDIAITQKHIVIPVFGFETSLERLKAGKIHWAWNARLPTYFGILPRDGSARRPRWFKGPPRELVHTFNAYTVGDRVILESPVGETNPFPFFPPDPGNEDPPEARRGWQVRRHLFDLGSPSDAYSEEILDDHPIGPFGRIDDRYISLEHRYVFAQLHDPAMPFDGPRTANFAGRVNNCYARIDLKGRALSTYFAGPTHTLGEPVFVPRRAGSPEGDGYLIGVASNFRDMRSELVIADAQRLGAGDLARVILPFRLGPQVHGNWLPAAALGLG
jgi:carotenoid cleavage dioxygenase-like enzyme